MSNFSLQNSSTNNVVDKLVYQPTTTSTIWVNPGSGNGDNICNDFNEAYTRISLKSGALKYISFVPGATATSYFANSSGSYDMSQIGLTQSDARLLSLTMPAAITLVNLRFFQLLNCNLDIGSMTQALVDYNTSAGATEYLLIENVNITSLAPQPFVGVTSATVTTLSVTIKNCRTQVNNFVVAAGKNVILSAISPGQSDFPAAAITATNLTMVINLATPNISKLNADYTNVTNAIVLQEDDVVNTVGIIAPAVDDDGSRGFGYSIGSSWVDTVAGDAYICIDNADGAAVWKQTTP